MNTGLPPVNSPDFEAIQSGYDRMWADGQHQIKRNGVVADSVPDPAHHRARWGISVVAHFDEAFASSLLELVDQVRPLCSETHTFYDASTLHTTLRACEFYRDGVGEQDFSVEGYREVLGGLCRRHAPFMVVYEGLNGNHTGIIVQGYALAGLRGFRLELHRQLTERGLPRPGGRRGSPDHPRQPDGVRRPAGTAPRRLRVADRAAQAASGPGPPFPAQSGEVPAHPLRRCAAAAGRI